MTVFDVNKLTVTTHDNRPRHHRNGVIVLSVGADKSQRRR